MFYNLQTLLVVTAKEQVLQTPGARETAKCPTVYMAASPLNSKSFVSKISAMATTPLSVVSLLDKVQKIIQIIRLPKWKKGNVQRLKKNVLHPQIKKLEFKKIFLITFSLIINHRPDMW